MQLKRLHTWNRLSISSTPSVPPPVITSPSPAATMSTTAPTITWSGYGETDEVEIRTTLTGTPTATGISGGSYTSPALALSSSPYYARTRRAGGEWSEAVSFYVNPLSVGTMFLWLQGDYGTYQDSAGTLQASATGDPVGKWLDRSGQGNHALQTGDTALKPRIMANAINGLSAIKFDGVDDYLSIAYNSTLNPNHLQLYIVFYMPNTAGWGLLDRGETGYRIYKYNSNLGTNVANSDDTNIYIPAAYGAVITRLKYNRTRIAWKKSGSSEVTRANTAAISGTNPLILANASFDQWVYGIFAYTAELGASEEAALEAYLTSLTGVTV